MIPKEVLDKIRRIEITTSRLVTDTFAGQYHSVFKGRGMEFDEVREYQPGDDIRSIDWNVTARTGVAHVKKFVEERELTVMIMVDMSASCRFATVRELKSKLAAEIAAVLAFSAIRNNDKTGLLIFTDTVEKFIPPRKGRAHVLRIIREVLFYQPRGKGTDISGAMDFICKVYPRRTVCFVLSDFLESSRQKDSEKLLSRSLTVASRRHDMIAISLNDPLEVELPDCGMVLFEDAENGRRIRVDTSAPQVREHYRQKALRRLEARRKLFSAAGVDHIHISTDKPYTDSLVCFFSARRKRAR